MAKSITKIKEQIAKLQKEADSIQSTVISRIRKEIAQFELTAEHLFGAIAGADAKKAPGARQAATAAGKKKAASKPAKYADGQGNAWGGMGKRPQWLHAALEAGHALEEFLVAGAKPTPKAKAKRATKPAATPARKAVTAKKKPAKATAAPAKRSRKAAVPAKKAAARKTPARKTSTKAPSSSERPAT